MSKELKKARNKVVKKSNKPSSKTKWRMCSNEEIANCYKIPEGNGKVYKRLAEESKNLVISVGKVSKSLRKEGYLVLEESILPMVLIAFMDRSWKYFDDRDIEFNKNIEDFLMDRFRSLTYLGLSVDKFKDEFRKVWGSLEKKIKAKPSSLLRVDKDGKLRKIRSKK